MPLLSPLVTSDGLRLAVAAGGDDGTVVVPNGAYFSDDLTAVWRRHPALVYDLRNRGASDPVADQARLARGVLNDVDDLGRCAAASAAIASTWSPICTSGSWPRSMRPRTRIFASAAWCCCLRWPRRMPGGDSPAASGRDGTRVFACLAALQQAPPAGDADARCRAFWAVLQDLYVVDPALAPRVADWGRCALPNATGLHGLLDGARRAVASARRSIRRRPRPRHGRGCHWRTAPRIGVRLGTGGARAWSIRPPNVWLLTLDGAAHAPWIERPEVVDAVARFLDGDWPEAADVVRD